MARKTLDQFIVDSNNIHVHKYDYSKTIYTNNKTKVEINCTIHGPFIVTPGNHLKGRGCKYCSGFKKERVDTSKIVNEDGSRIISLTQGMFAIVDSEDYDRINKHSWCVTDGYARSKIGGVLTPMHRYILNDFNPKILIDHSDRNPLNNRKNNLRKCNKSQNNMNQRPWKNAFSKYKGVKKRRRKILPDCWEAGIRAYGVIYRLGLFDNEIDAAISYDKKAMELHGEFAYLNFPEKIVNNQNTKKIK